MPATDVFSPGSTALITGGASGIGLALARFSLAKGLNVLIADRNEPALEAAKKELTPADASASHPKVVTASIDVSKLEDWSRLRELAVKEFGSIELLALNAGTTARGTWGDAEYFRTTLETNLFGVLHGINTFLSLIQSSSAKATSIIITGSKQGITNPPGNPAYNASKAALKSIAEQLSWSLKEEKTSVHLLVPGWTFTSLAGATEGREKPAGAWLPEQVIDYLYKKMADNQFYVICPDNDVDETLDQKRMLWSAGDVVYGRPALSRWREEFKGGAENVKIDK